MNMEDDRLVQFLMTEYGWWEAIARAMVRAMGRCEYCEEDLLVTRSGYSSIVLDHILPKGKYPHLSEDPNNHALSCSSCNTMKGRIDPLSNADALSVIDLSEEFRRDLICEVKEALSSKIESRRKEWERIRDAFNS